MGQIGGIPLRNWISCGTDGDKNTGLPQIAPTYKGAEHLSPSGAI